MFIVPLIIFSVFLFLYFSSDSQTYTTNSADKENLKVSPSSQNISEYNENNSLNPRSSFIPSSEYIFENQVDIVHTPSLGRFCYSHLNKDQQLCYEKIRKAVEQHRDYLLWNNNCCDFDMLNKILMYVTFDYPEYFWYSNESCYIEYNSSDKVPMKINFKYEYSRDEVYQINGEIYSEVKKYLEGVSNLTTDYDRALNAYEHIINNTTYDNVRANAGYNSFADMDGDTMSCWNITGVFLNHNAICRGYAQAYQYLMNLQGIECGYVYGGGHCWNIIKLDNEWYYIDVTWGDPVTELRYTNTGEIRYIEQGIDYSFFCMTTEQLLQLHTPDADINPELPQCTATKYNYFEMNKNSGYKNYFDK